MVRWFTGLSISLVFGMMVSGTCAVAKSSDPVPTAPVVKEKGQWSLAIHGGAGVIVRENMTTEQEAAYRAALNEALAAGSAILRNGGSALDAVKAAIIPMEDSPLFNAGKGAVYTWDGAIELDAAIMDGRDRSAGAVTGIKTVRNPILLADAIRKDGRHVFLSGAGAEVFADDSGLARVPRTYFETDRRKRALERLKQRSLAAIDVDHKYGTVGAVALDRHGNVAAGTSTGGLTGKRWGRIGDAPVIGAGTYADNRACAVSATGAGEYFIRVGVAHEICTRLRLQNSASPLLAGDVQKIADDVMSDVAGLGGDGGVIVITPEGHAHFSFNTPGMYRGRANSHGMHDVAIFSSEISSRNHLDPAN